MREPIARRPYMPGYGIQVADDGAGLLPWSWAVERVRASHDYWVATVWPDGRPHVTPVWGVWLDHALWFSCSPESRKTRNLAANPNCVATTDNALEPVIVDGAAQRVSEHDAAVRFAEAINPKYSTEIPVDFFVENALFRLVPSTALGLTEAAFTTSPTRWTFAPGD